MELGLVDIFSAISSNGSFGSIDGDDYVEASLAELSICKV